MDYLKDANVLDKNCGFRQSLIKIWIFVSFLPISYGSIEDNSSTIIDYTSVFETQTYTVSVSEIEATASVDNNSVPVSSMSVLPSNCCRVCVCNGSDEGNVTSSMECNMTEYMTLPINMTTMSVNMTSASLNTSYNVSMSHTPSSASMSYTARASVSVMSHNSSVRPKPSSIINWPFVCTSESCRTEVECITHTNAHNGSFRTLYGVTATTLSESSVVLPTETDSTLTSTTTSYDVATTDSTLSTTSVSLTVLTITPTLCSGSIDCHDSTVITTTSYDMTASISPTDSASSVMSTSTSCSGSLGCHDSTVITTTSYDMTASISPTDLATSVLSTSTSCSGSLGCHDSTVIITTSYDVTAPISPTDSASSVMSTTESPCSGSLGCHDSPQLTPTTSYDFTSSISPTATSSESVSSTETPCFGSLDCHGCGGDGSTCTKIIATVPSTIASTQPRILIIGAGLDRGSATVCVLYDAVSGDMLVNTTATERNVTHALCEFEPSVSYPAGVYNLSVTIVQNGKPDVKTNKSLPVYYYRTQDLSLTSVIPNELLMEDLPLYVTLKGTGFFNWKETRCYFGSLQSSDVIFVNETHLQCKVPRVEASIRLSVSLSMDFGLVRVGLNVDLTVYARAPIVLKVKFSVTAAKILILFNIEVYIASADETCNKIFQTGTFALLGSDPKCSLCHTRKLQIILGVGANISIGDNLVFKNNMIKARNEQYSKFLRGSYPVNSSDIPLKPTPVITGPDTLSSCGNLTLSGSQSFGGGGRSLKFVWSLISPGSGDDVTEITNVTSGLRSDSNRVTIPGALFEAGKTYVFKLAVANFLNASSFEEVTHSIIKATVPVPALMLSSNIRLNKGEVFVSEDLSIRTIAIVAPCVNDTKVDFSWTVTCSDVSAKQKVESSPSFQATKNQATLRIDHGVLTADITFIFNVTGSMNYDPSVQSSASQVIKAFPSPLQPAIVGGDRQIGQDSGAIKLEAKLLTVDPDQTSHALSCNWSCELQGGGSCVSALDSISNCVTEVQSNLFLAGKTYKISAVVYKGSRSATKSIMLTVVAGNPPAVWINQRLASKKLKASDGATLEGYYKTNNKPTVKWSSSQELGFGYVNLSRFTPIAVFNPGNNSFVLLTLPKGLLTPCSKYRFKLTVDDGSEVGVASLDVEVRTGPTSGSLSVEPMSVKALDTVTLSALQWTSAPDAVPLRYVFGVLVEEDVCDRRFGIPSTDPERKQIIPPGSGPNNTLTLCVVVLDKFDSDAMATVNIISSPPDPNDLTPDAINSLLRNAVEAPLQSGNVDAVVGALSSIIVTVQDSNDTTDELKSNISKKTQEVIVDIVGSAVIDQDIALPLLTTLIKTDAKAADNSSIVAQAAVTILKRLGDKPLTDDKADDFLKWIGDLTEGSIDKDVSLKETVKEAFDALADNIGAELKCEDPPREVSDDRLGSVKVQVSTLKYEIVSSNKSAAPKFDPGSALSEQYSAPRECGGGKICCGVFLKLVQYKENLIVEDKSKQSDDVQVVSSQVFGVDLRHPITKEPLVIQSLSPPIKLTFTITSVPDGKMAGCVYFDEQQRIWVKTGLKAIGPAGNLLICESTHATFFAPSHDSIHTTVVGKSDVDYTAGIVGIVMGILAGILVIFLIIAIVWWRKHKTINTDLPTYDDRF